LSPSNADATLTCATHLNNIAEQVHIPMATPFPDCNSHPQQDKEL